MPMDQTEDSSSCNSTPMNLRSATDRLRLEREERATARLRRRRQREQERRRSEQTEVRQARLDRQRVCDHERRAAEQPAARQARLDRRRLCDHERRAAEQPEARQARLDRRRLCDHERRAAEQPEARQARLDRRRLCDHKRRAAEQPEARQARLVTDRQRNRERRAAEQPEARQARLGTDRQRTRERRSAEQPEARQARLERLRERNREQRAAEQAEARQARLARNREASRRRRQAERQSEPQRTSMPALEDEWVQGKLAAFHAKMSSLSFTHCSCCNESFPSIKLTSGDSVCSRCSRDKQEPKLYSAANNMDPGSVPLALQGLTQVEEMLISPVMPIMSVYKLPLGQYGYSGHVINLPQDVASFVRSLPRVPSQLDVVVVHREGATGSHKDFKVRRSRVLQALLWLMENNQYFREISLDHAALAQLPEDGELSGLSAVTLPHDESGTESDFEECDSEQLSSSFVPAAPRQATEQEAVEQVVSGEQPVAWPPHGDTPLNEFHSEGYITLAFPTLFPTGAADFTMPRMRPVTLGYYLKHLIMYNDGRFARHPRFRYFALNTEMRWRALQAGHVYVRQHPEDARLSVDELRDMVGTSFSSRVCHYAGSLRGTRPYWMKQRSCLIAMVDTLGLPTVFFTHSAADFQWPELSKLICQESPEDASARRRAVIDNPAVADWFFYERLQQFLKCFYLDILGAKDYWLRFEWQHHGSPHVHGLAWLPGAPDVQLFTDPAAAEENRQQAIAFIDSVISTTNQALLPDGSNLSEAPRAQTDPHICNQAYAEVTDHEQDLSQLIATCQRHTVCSPAYCLRTKHGKQECRFHYPKALCEETVVSVEDGDVELQTARNDPLINSFNPIQLSGWRANVDMQYCVSRQKVISYCAKYVTKCEPRSQSLKDVYAMIVRGLKENDGALKAVQKLLISTTAERDYSAQETCHLLLMLPMYMASCDFVMLSLDGSRQVEERLEEGKSATALSALDHYISRPATPQFEEMTLLHFVQHYSMPKSVGEEPVVRKKMVVVRVRPHCSPNTSGLQYEQYCQQKLMLHRPFREYQQLKAGYDTYAEAFAGYLQSGSIPPSLEDDLYRLQQQQEQQDSGESDSDSEEVSDEQGQHNQAREEWMLLCSNLQQSPEEQEETQQSTDWTAAAQLYPNLQEAPRFVTHAKENAQLQVPTSTADPERLQAKQRLVYNAVCSHIQAEDPEPLRMVVSGTAGTGKSFLIHCLKALLLDRLRVMAPTGVAAFNVGGFTLHSLLHLPTRGEFKALEGEQLQQLQQCFSGVDYLIIDEMSMLGRKLFGQVDQRLRQAFPHHAGQALGGCSCLLVGDFGQLPPVMDLPLYSAVPRSAIADLGRSTYQLFAKAVVLTEVLRQDGQDREQVRFQELLLHLKDGEVSVTDWELLMTRCRSQVDSAAFDDALHLHPTVQAVAEYNVAKLRNTGEPIATIKAVHTGPNASKPSPEDASGLEPVICLARGARVMLTSNLWTDAGLVNGAMRTVQAICYQSGSPPSLPVAVMVKFDKYRGPTLHDGSVPIVPQ